MKPLTEPSRHWEATAVMAGPGEWEKRSEDAQEQGRAVARQTLHQQAVMADVDPDALTITEEWAPEGARLLRAKGERRGAGGAS